MHLSCLWPALCLCYTVLGWVPPLLPHSQAGSIQVHPWSYYPPSYNPSEVCHGPQPQHSTCRSLAHSLHACPGSSPPTVMFLFTLAQTTLFRMPFLFYVPPRLDWLSPTHVLLLKSGSTSSMHSLSHPYQSSLGSGTPVKPRTHTFLNSTEPVALPATRFPKVGPSSESPSIPCFQQRLARGGDAHCLDWARAEEVTFLPRSCALLTTRFTSLA